MFPLSYHIYFELAAFLVSLLLWKTLVKTKIIWFVPYLFIIVLVELSARYLYYELKQPNAWIYNLSVPLEFCFYSFIIFLHTTNKLFQTIIKFFIFAFLLFAVYSIVFITGFKSFNRDFLVIGGFFMMLFITIYLGELYREDHENSMWVIPVFWICLGILLFYSGSFSRNLLGWFGPREQFTSAIRILRSINHGLNYVLYSCLIIAFICQKIFVKYRTV